MNGFKFLSQVNFIYVTTKRIHPYIFYVSDGNPNSGYQQGDYYFILKQDLIVLLLLSCVITIVLLIYNSYKPISKYTLVCNFKKSLSTLLENACMLVVELYKKVLYKFIQQII